MTEWRCEECGRTWPNAHPTTPGELADHELDAHKGRQTIHLVDEEAPA